MTLSTVVFPIKAEIVADSTNPQQEMAQLEQYESLLKRCGDSAWESAAAITEIIDRKLYRLVGYERFQDYCEVRLGVGRQWAYKLRKAHVIMQALSPESGETELTPAGMVVLDASSRPAVSPLGDTEPAEPSTVPAIQPGTVALLAPLSEEIRVAVLARLQEQASNGVAITQAVVRATVKAEQEAATAAAAPPPIATTEPTIGPVESQPEPEPEPEPVVPAKPECQVLAEKAIANGAHGAAVLKQVRQSIKALRELPALPGLEMLSARKESVARHLESAANAITAYLPAIVCPKCNGATCPDCGNHGWLNKAAQRSINSQSR